MSIPTRPHVRDDAANEAAERALYEAPLRSPTTTPAEQQAIAEATKAEAVKPTA